METCGTWLAPTRAIRADPAWGAEAFVATAARQPEIEDRLFRAGWSEEAGGSFDRQRRRLRLGQGAVRGAIAAMAMTGLREFTRHVGLLEEPPPEAIVRQRLSRRWFRNVQRGPRRAQVELAHWTYGAAAGAIFAAVPGLLRRSPWSGPLYGLIVWGSFELGTAPLLALSQARRSRPLDRPALAGDHLFYGFLLGEGDPEATPVRRTNGRPRNETRSALLCGLSRQTLGAARRDRPRSDQSDAARPD
jgi:hypothetical protein